MRILILASSFPRFSGDGTAPFIKSIAENLVRQGHEVNVLVPYDQLVEPEVYPGYHVQRFKYIWPRNLHVLGHARSLEADARLRPLAYLLLPLYLINMIFHAVRTIQKCRCEVMHVNWVLPNGVAGWVVSILTGVPYVVSLHGSDIFVARKSRVFGLVARLVFKYAKGVSACSQDLRKGALDLGASPSKTVLLAWGADPDIFFPTDKKTIRSSLGLPVDAKIVTAVGRLVHKKGFAVLLHAWRQLDPENRNAFLVIGGDGPLKKDFKNIITQYHLENTVKLWGAVPWDRMPSFLAAGDIFVLPSVLDEFGNVDGLPTVLLEAMACGNAVVASEIGGVNLVIEDRKNGILVRPGDGEQLAQTLRDLLQDPQMQNILGAQARRSVVEKYNWYNVTTSLTKIF